MAQLALPSAVALDSNGRLLIADTNNQRVRAVANGVISSIAGDGEELFSGEGGQAIAASLDQPTGIAVDTAGNVYIADKRNQRIRVVNTVGVISTFAGSGDSPFSGSFSGDGGQATAASLARPVGVSVDSSGNLLTADTNNQRIREVSGGSMITLAGSGEQGFVGDGGPVRRRARRLGSLSLFLALVGTGIVMTTLTGCGSANGFFGQGQTSYTIQVVGTAKSATGTSLQHVADVQLTLQ